MLSFNRGTNLWNIFSIVPLFQSFKDIFNEKNNPVRFFLDLNKNRVNSNFDDLENHIIAKASVIIGQYLLQLMKIGMLSY